MSRKAYDLDNAIASFVRGGGPDPSTIPLLNGMLDLDVLDTNFGLERVLGGIGAIAADARRQGDIVQLHPLDSIVVR